MDQPNHPPLPTADAVAVPHDGGDDATSKTEPPIPIPITPDFDSMGLTQDLLRGIYAYGYAKPSDLQQRAIVPLVQGRDVIAVSPSGTGSTSTLVIGLLQRLDPSQHVLQALIVAPTRELAHRRVLISSLSLSHTHVHAYAI
jgi:ATP-dependent RNA helicase